MKKIVAIALLSLTFTLQACAQEKWVEGEHYQVIDEPASDKPVITEFFSFWCPHCFNFEPIVAKIKSRIGDDVGFKKVHVNFMRFTGSDVQDAATTAMMVGRALDKADQMNQAIFNYIHVQRQPITGLAELKGIFVANGMQPDEFDKLASSFQVKNQLSQNNKLVEQYRQHVNGVPNFIVNGKYQATFTRDMTVDDMVDLIVWLSDKK